MRSRRQSGTSWPRAALLAATVLLVAGCLHHPDRGTPIPPLPAAGEQVDPGLGSEAQPLSSGPGFKGSPSWSPRGGRIAFTVDGYTVDRPLGTGDTRRWTRRNFVAEDAEWISGDGLAIFGASSGSAPGGETPRSVYRTRP